MTGPDSGSSTNSDWWPGVWPSLRSALTPGASSAPGGVEPVDEQVVLREARHRVVAHEARDRPRREAGVEQDRRVSGAHEPARDGELELLRGELAVDQARE